MTEVIREKLADILEECHSTPGLESFTSKPLEVTIEEDPLFLDGYSSVIVRLRASDGSTVIAKHAPPYLRQFGDAIPLPVIRAELEMTGLQLLERYIPGAAAKPFFFSSKHHTTLMEDLGGYKVLHSELIAGNVNKAAIGSIAMNYATLHRSTHKENISKEDWANLEEKMNKFQPMQESLMGMVKSYPCFTGDPQDDVTKQLKQIADSRVFNDCKLSEFLDQWVENFVHGSECLLHGDSQTQNTLVKGDDIKMIDFEMMRLGKCSLEMAAVFADLVFSYYYHLVSPEDVDRHRQTALKIRECTHHLVNTYLEHMSWRPGEKVHHVANFMKEFAAGVGCFAFTIIGFGVRPHLGASQIQMLEAAIRLMEQHHVADSVEQIYSILALE